MTVLPAPEPDFYGRWDHLDTPTYHLGDWHGNAIDEWGVAWIVESEDGWSGSPPRRTSMTDRPQDDGSYGGLAYFSARTISLSGKAICETRAQMLAAKRRFAAVCSTRGPQVLYVAEADMTLQATVLPTGENKAKDTGMITFDWSLQVTAPDPRKYELVETAGGCYLPDPAASGGASFPITAPLIFGNPNAVYRGSGDIRLINNGTYAVPGVLRVTGATTSWTVTHAETGRTLSMDTPLTAADMVTLDTALRQATVNGTLRNDLLDQRGWFLFGPGPNTLQFRGVGGPTATLSASFLGAYI